MTPVAEQLLLPLRAINSLVNFFSPPVPHIPSVTQATTHGMAHDTRAPSKPLKLAKAPALPLMRPVQTTVRTQAAGIRLVNPTLMGQAPSRPQTPAAHVLRSRRAQDGRIVIAGRFSDVCAELDRLCAEPVQ
jgi:hypothetical protein